MAGTLAAPRGRTVWRVALVLAVLAAGHTALWLAACARLRAGYEAVIAQQQAAGWTIDAAKPARAGWPWSAGLDVAALTATAAAPGGVGSLSWTAPLLQVRLNPLHPSELRIGAPGQHVLRLGSLPAITAEARPMQATVPLDGAAPVLTASGLEVGSPGGTIRAGAATLRLAAPAATLAVQDVTGPAGSLRIEALSARALLTQPIPAGPSLHALAESWHKSGGAVDLPEILLSSGPLRLTGHGTLRLDAALQPAFDGVAAVTGYRAALESLGQSGALPARTASTVAAVLDLLAAPNGGTVANLPVQVRDGLLVVARFPLLRLPALDWGPP